MRLSPIVVETKNLYSGHHDWIWDVAFNHDGRYVATAGKDDDAILWNTNGDLISTLRGHTNWVRAIAFSPDGQKLASASADVSPRRKPNADKRRMQNCLV